MGPRGALLRILIGAAIGSVAVGGAGAGRGRATAGVGGRLVALCLRDRRGRLWWLSPDFHALFVAPRDRDQLIEDRLAVSGRLHLVPAGAESDLVVAGPVDRDRAVLVIDAHLHVGVLDLDDQRPPASRDAEDRGDQGVDVGQAGRLGRAQARPAPARPPARRRPTPGARSGGLLLARQAGQGEP